MYLHSKCQIQQAIYVKIQNNRQYVIAKLLYFCSVMVNHNYEILYDI